MGRGKWARRCLQSDITESPMQVYFDEEMIKVSAAVKTALQTAMLSYLPLKNKKISDSQLSYKPRRSWGNSF